MPNGKLKLTKEEGYVKCFRCGNEKLNYSHDRNAYMIKCPKCKADMRIKDEEAGPEN